MNFEQARFNMVEQQIRPWDVLDPKVLDLLMNTPRHEYVSEAQQSLAYMDIELPIGEGQSMLPPRVEGRILQALDIESTETVLEIGTGSGYLTALLAKSAQDVTTVDYSQSLLTSAKERLSQFDNIQYQSGDASSGWDDQKTYDIIVIGGALAELPENYKAQLNIGGRLVATTGNEHNMKTFVMTRVSDEEWDTETLFEANMPYLKNGEPKSSFSL